MKNLMINKILKWSSVIKLTILKQRNNITYLCGLSGVSSDVNKSVLFYVVHRKPLGCTCVLNHQIIFKFWNYLFLSENYYSIFSEIYRCLNGINFRNLTKHFSYQHIFQRSNISWFPVENFDILKRFRISRFFSKVYRKLSFLD